MVSYPIRYRFNGPGPAALLVECENELRMFCRGRLCAPLTEREVAVLLGGRGGRWVAATGEVTVDDGVRSVERGDPSGSAGTAPPGVASA